MKKTTNNASNPPAFLSNSFGAAARNSPQPTASSNRGNRYSDLTAILARNSPIGQTINRSQQQQQTPEQTDSEAPAMHPTPTQIQSSGDHHNNSQLNGSMIANSPSPRPSASVTAFDLSQLDAILRSVAASSVEPSAKMADTLSKVMDQQAKSSEAMLTQINELHAENQRLKSQLEYALRKEEDVKTSRAETTNRHNEERAQWMQEKQRLQAEVVRERERVQQLQQQGTASSAQHQADGHDSALTTLVTLLAQQMLTQQQQAAQSMAMFSNMQHAAALHAHQQAAMHAGGAQQHHQQQQLSGAQQQQLSGALVQQQPPADPMRAMMSQFAVEHRQPVLAAQLKQTGGTIELMSMPSLNAIPAGLNAQSTFENKFGQPLIARSVTDSASVEKTTSTVPPTNKPASVPATAAANIPTVTHKPISSVGGFQFSGEPKIITAAALTKPTTPKPATPKAAVTVASATTTQASSPFAGFGGFGLGQLPSSHTSTTMSTSKPATAQERQPLLPSTKVVPSIGDNSVFHVKSEAQPVATNTTGNSSAATATPPKPVFSGFGFGTPKTTAGTTGTTATASPLALGGFSFAVNKPSTPTKPQPTVSSPAANNEASSRTRTESDSSDHYEPNVEFAPVVPLPDLVEVVTGEEEEEVLFNSRAKLYRFVKETAEYKERGIGDLKILRHYETKKVRLLLRREQVHKLAANHWITSDMKIAPMQSSTKSFMWTANDFSEEEVKLTTFAARFKADEDAIKFKQVFEQCVSQAVKSTTPIKPKEDKPKVAEVPQAKGFGDAFKPKAGSWECSTCMTRNDGSRQVCVCCDTPKDGSAADASTNSGTPSASSSAAFKPTTFTTPQSATTGGFSFGFGSATTTTTATPTATATPIATATPTTTAGSVAPAAGSPAAAFSFKPSLLAGASPSTPKTTQSSTPAFNTSSTTSPMNFSFKSGGAADLSKSSISASNNTPSNTSTGAGGFTFGQKGMGGGGTGLIFGQKPADSAKPATAAPVFGSAAASPGGGGFTFGQKAATTSTIGAGAGGMTFGSLAAKSDSDAGGFGEKTGLFDKPSAKPFADVYKQNADESGADATGADDDHFEPNIEYTPVVPLPNLVEVKTGEEDETALFCERAKLYRFVKELNEYKERGLGDLKILEHNQTGKCRLLLRREQVHKLAANHLITPTMKLTPMSTSSKAFIWTANDYSEEELKLEMFAARFKTDDQASKFKAVFEQAAEKMAKLPSSPPKANGAADIGEAAKPSGPGFGDQFKAAAGSWECTDCMTRNQATDNICVCCTSARPQPGVPKQLFGTSTQSPLPNTTGGAIQPFSLAGSSKSPSANQSGSEATLKALHDLGYVDPNADADDYYEDGADTCVYHGQATLHTSVLATEKSSNVVQSLPVKAVGHVKIVIDEDLDPGYRVQFESDGGPNGQLLNHPIVKQNSIEVSTKKGSPWYVRWETYDFSLNVWRRCRFQLDFGNSRARDDFAGHYNKGLSIAQENDYNEFTPESSTTPLEETDAFKMIGKSRW